MRDSKKGIFKTGAIMNSRMSDRTILTCLILLVLLSVSSTGSSNDHAGIVIILITLFCFAVLSAIDIFSNFFNPPKTSFKETIYPGSLEELVKELAGLGIEPKSQVGNTYVFTSTTMILPRRSVFVRDMGEACLLYGLHLKDFCRLEKEAVVNYERSPNNNT